MATCSKCDGVHHARGLCKPCYQRYYASPRYERLVDPYDPIAAFWRQTVVRDDKQCWTWTGPESHNGYGRITLNYASRVTGATVRRTMAHRFAYELLVGPISPGLTIDHLCRNRACVNPDHLEAVTQRVNTMRGMSPTAIRARSTHCAQGHEYTSENIYEVQGRRRCRICQRAKSRAWRAKKRERATEH